MSTNEFASSVLCFIWSLKIFFCLFHSLDLIRVWASFLAPFNSSLKRSLVVAIVQIFAVTNPLKCWRHLFFIPVKRVGPSISVTSVVKLEGAKFVCLFVSRFLLWYACCLTNHRPFSPLSPLLYCNQLSLICITLISLINVEPTFTNFEKFHPPQNKNPPSSFINFLDFSTLHSSFIRFMY